MKYMDTMQGYLPPLRERYEEPFDQGAFSTIHAVTLQCSNEHKKRLVIRKPKNVYHEEKVRMAGEELNREVLEQIPGLAIIPTWRKDRNTHDVYMTDLRFAPIGKTTGRIFPSPKEDCTSGENVVLTGSHFTSPAKNMQVPNMDILTRNTARICALCTEHNVRLKCHDAMWFVVDLNEGFAVPILADHKYHIRPVEGTVVSERDNYSTGYYSLRNIFSESQYGEIDAYFPLEKLSV